MERAVVDQRPMIDAVWPRAGASREVILALGGSLLIALSAQLRVPLPFSPVPITGQTFAVLLIGALYGSRRAPGTIATYLTLGLLGLPVFQGGTAGLAVLLGPTAGYLVGYLPAAWLVGFLSERGAGRSPSATALSMIAGNIVIYSTGVVVLARFVGWNQVVATGVAPFLVGDAVKIALATVALPAGWRLLGTSSQGRPAA
jgi:biotin transport system substrate-specific component